MVSINELAFRSGQSHNTVHYKACHKFSSIFHLQSITALLKAAMLTGNCALVFASHSRGGGWYRLFVYFRNRNTLTSTDANKVLKLSFEYQCMSDVVWTRPGLAGRGKPDSWLAVRPLLEFLALTQYQIGDTNKGSPQAGKKEESC